MIDRKWPIIKVRNLEKTYRLGETEVKALRGVTFEAMAGEIIGIRGSSGSGKTTLLNLIGGLDCALSGEIQIAGRVLNGMSDHEISGFRAKELGFIFQNFNLLPVLSALENVEYPLLKSAMKSAERGRAAMNALKRVGLEKFIHHRPDQLSGGQRQRVAIARAFVHGPSLILADEPTANLDRRTADGVLDLLCDLNRTMGLTIVVATHDPAVLARTTRVLPIVDGRLALEEALEGKIDPARSPRPVKVA